MYIIELLSAGMVLRKARQYWMASALCRHQWKYMKELHTYLVISIVSWLQNKMPYLISACPVHIAHDVCK
jgi:hypothetical protein